MLYKFEDVFKIIEFPSGETHVRCGDVFPRTNDDILKRCNNWQDIMHVVNADEILSRNGCKVNWFIPYKPFARQDRVTGTGHACESYILQLLFKTKDIRVLFIDVHSDTFAKDKYTNPAYSEIPQETILRFFETKFPEKYIRVVPDKGARKKLRPTTEAIVCEKTRDPITGVLSNFRVESYAGTHIERELDIMRTLLIDGKPVPGMNLSTKLLLIDDICDGGGTFFALADILRPIAKAHDIKLELLVTHGIFSKGVDRLLLAFDKIYTTNSYDKNIKLKCLDPKFVVFDVEEIFNYAIGEK